MEIDKNKMWLLIGIGIFIVFIGFLVWNSWGGKEAVAGKVHSTGAVGIESICYDNVDNDKDGKVDCADKDCDGIISAEKEESGCTLEKGCYCQRPELNCADGFDNDRDGSASLRTIGEMRLNGVTIIAKVLYDGLGAMVNSAGLSVKISPKNFQVIIQQIGVEVPELTNNCILLGCWMVYQPDNKALVVSEQAMVVIDTSNFKSYHTTAGSKTLQQVNTALLNVGDFKVDIIGNSFNIGAVVGKVEYEGKIQENLYGGNGAIGMVTASASGIDCADEDCDGKIGPKGIICGEACTPQCTGKQCGGDGCGGSCGSCTSGQTCETNGNCVSPTISCTDSNNWNKTECHNQSCDSNNSSKLVIWSYDLPPEMSKKEAETPPSKTRIGCCGENSCVWSNICTDFSELDPSAAFYFCGQDNSWVKCYAATLGTAQQAGSKTYNCTLSIGNWKWVETTPTIMGDINNDKCVNDIDLSIIADNVDLDCVGGNPPASLIKGDVNNDGCVNDIDLSIIADNVNLDCVGK